MKNANRNVEDKVPNVKINKALNKYSNVVLFPEKVAKAKAEIEKYGLPDQVLSSIKKNNK